MRFEENLERLESFALTHELTINRYLARIDELSRTQGGGGRAFIKLSPRRRR